MRALRHGAEYVAARSLAGTLRVLPHAVAQAFGASLGGFAATRVRFRIDVVEKQIAAAFPDESADWVRRTAIGAYRHFGREMVQMARLGPRLMARADEFMKGEDEPREWLEEVMAGGRGALLVTGHVGNWEMAGAYLSHSGFPISAVVKRQSNEAFDRFIWNARRQIGIEPIYMEEAYTRIPEAIERGRLVALVADQDAGPRGIFVPHMGRMASTFKGPARLALTLRVPLFFGAAVRDGETYRGVLERVETGAESPKDTEALRRITTDWVSRLDRLVREVPDQYFWFHRRWKSRPPAGRVEDKGKERDPR